MNIQDIRDELMIYIADADEAKLKALHTLLDLDVDRGKTELTEEQWSVVEERQREYKAGNYDSRDWGKIKQDIRKGKSDK